LEEETTGHNIPRRRQLPTVIVWRCDAADPGTEQWAEEPWRLVERQKEAQAGQCPDSPPSPDPVPDLLWFQLPFWFTEKGILFLSRAIL
jgi:hypothetical protein